MTQWVNGIGRVAQRIFVYWQFGGLITTDILGAASTKLLKLLKVLLASKNATCNLPIHNKSIAIKMTNIYFFLLWIPISTFSILLKADMKSYIPLETAAIFFWRTDFFKQGISSEYVMVDFICMGLLDLIGITKWKIRAHSGTFRLWSDRAKRWAIRADKYQSSGLQGSVNVHRGTLLLVPQWQCISCFVFFI